MSSMAALWQLGERSNLKIHKMYICSSDFLKVCTKMDVVYKLRSGVARQGIGQNSLFVSSVNRSSSVSRASFMHVCMHVSTYNF